MSVPAHKQTNNEARDAILRSIRENLAQSAAVDARHEHVPVTVGEPRSASTSSNLSPVSAFRERLESVGGHCVTVRDDAEAATALAQVVADLHGSGNQRLALSDAPALAALTKDVAAGEITTCPPAADLFGYDVGISTAQAGIAETGTLILEVEKERNRLVSLLPPVHIAVIRSDDIYLTIGDALNGLRGDRQELSRAITFITGPSRTADIELTLTVGVHGPKELYVIVIDRG